MKEIYREVPLTEDDIIDILQQYKPSLSKIFQKPVILSVDEEGNIHVSTSVGQMSLEPIVNTSLKVVSVEELKRPVAIVKLVEEWWEVLTPQQRKAIFYRYVDHSNTQYKLDVDDFRIKYNAKSEREAARLLNVSKTTLREIVDRALKKIVRWINEVQ